MIGAGAVAASRLAGVDPELVRTAAWLVAIGLWFHAVYSVATAAVPALVAAHDRWGLLVPAGLAATTVLADVLRRDAARPRPARCPG